MLREIIHPTEKRIVLELSDEYVNQEIEVLAFPVHEGKSVAPCTTDRYPLRGQPFSYREPFESVAEEDWQGMP